MNRPNDPAERPFFAPTQFERHRGPRVDENRSVAQLARFFARRTASGFGPIALLFTSLLAPMALWLYALLRVQGSATIGAAELGVAAGQEAAFVVENFGYFFQAMTVWVLLVHAALTAPQIAADARAGALLLYFSRPVRPAGYLVARVMASAGVAAIGTSLATIIVVVGHAHVFGWTLPAGALEASRGAISGAAFFPVAFMLLFGAGLLICVASALAAHACSSLVHRGGQPALLYAGAILASVGISWAGQLTWGRTSLARAFDLHHALQAPYFFATRLLDPVDAPPASMIDGAIGLGLWAAIVAGSWWILHRFLSNPPLSRGRA